MKFDEKPTGDLICNRILAVETTPFANFSLFFGAFIYMGSEAISNTPKSSQSINR
jgi:hypothetical protein